MKSVDEFLENRFIGNARALRYYIALWRDYQASNLGDPHFVKEITSGDEGCFWSRVWEMVLYRHLSGLTQEISSGSAGPDFCAVLGGKPVYIEAITPAPTGLTPEWLTPPKLGEVRVRSFPHEAILLRWTAA